MLARRGVLKSKVVIGRRGFVVDALSRHIDTVELAYDRYDPPGDPKGDPIVFLHGLFGSKVNNRSVSKVFARDLKRRVFCLDLRNHGDSPHTQRLDYPSLAADVERFIEQHQLGQVTMIGHSMGAKTAMAVALRNPHLVSSLIPVDNAPVDTRLSSAFPLYVKAMKEIHDSHVHTQKEAYHIMEKYEKSLPVQQFLLSNMKKNKHSRVYDFRIPLDILGRSLDKLGDFPYNPSKVRFSNPTLFIRGKYSP
jgi:pimeloyl-ACP methyl ester carboxylesterase